MPTITFQYGKTTKSDIVNCLENMITTTDPVGSPIVDAIILDGAAVVNNVIC